MPRNPVIRYTGYLRKLLKDDVTRLEIGDVLRAYLRSRYLKGCAEKVLRKVFKVDDILFEASINKRNVRDIAQRIRSARRRTRVLVIGLTPYDKTRSFIGPVEKHHILIVLDKAVIMMTVSKVDQEWGDTMYIISDDYEVIQV